MLRIAIRGVLVALAAVVAAGAAWLVVREQPKVYERTLTFVLLPGPTLNDSQIPDAVRGLSQQDAQLVNTIGAAIGSDRFLSEALRRADATEPAAYSARSSRRPGSDIVELRLRGPDPGVLAAVAEQHLSLATRWVGSVYRAYRLEFLQEDASIGAVEPRLAETVGLALLLGLFVGGAAVFVEWKARQRPQGRLVRAAATRAPRPREHEADRRATRRPPRHSPEPGESGSGPTRLPS
jgi:hypothetical protein